MNEFMVILRNVLIFVALAVPGYILVKTKMVKPEQSGIISKILMYLAIPLMIFSGVTKTLSFNPETLLLLGVSALLSVAVILGTFLLSGPLTKGMKNPHTRGMMRFCAIFANLGFLGIPLAVAVFGEDSPVFTVMVVINIINNVLLYTLGAYLASGDKKAINVRKAILNPVTVAFVLGCVCNLLKVTQYVPEVVVFSDYFSGLVTPLAMTIVGMKLAATPFKTLFRSGKLYYVAFMRLLLFPVIITGLMFLLKAVPVNLPVDSIIYAMFIAFSMPAVSMAATFADEYGGDGENAVIYTLGTTVLCVLTVPTLYWLLSLFL